MIKIPTSSNNESYFYCGNTAFVFGNFVTQGGSANVSEAVTVNFPITFGSTPVVFCSAKSTAPYTKAKNVTISGRTTQSFVANVLRTDNSAQGMNYIAIGEKLNEN